AREARAAFAISRALAVSSELADAAQLIVDELVRDARLDRAWITLDGVGRDRILADSAGATATGAAESIPSSSLHLTLARGEAEQPQRWIRAHDPRAARVRETPGAEGELLRVRLEVQGVGLGWLRALRRRRGSAPTPEETRLLALAADQVALAIRRDQLRAEATQMEAARQGDALKSALVDSVSHDLRTPLASIRAAAGTLTDPSVDVGPEQVQRVAATIDGEAERMDRLVRGLLDVSRIEAGALHPELEVHDLAALVEPVLERLRPQLGERETRLDLPDDLPPVRVDAVFLDESLTNLLENVARHAPPPAPIAISARATPPGCVTLVVEDGGPGVPRAAREHLFDKFYRVPKPAEGSRRGMGLGLAVVGGLVEAMDGRVEAGRSELGGLAISLVVPLADQPPPDEPALDAIP
ncbi:MAG: sensor histidine kinase, partial [Chloroflexota bacterium]